MIKYLRPSEKFSRFNHIHRLTEYETFNGRNYFRIIIR
jgi:hypothetical protein